MKAIWDTLYKEAKKVLKPRKVSEWVEAGGVAAAIETSCGNIYTGVCVDGACTLGICAERNAIFNMLTNGESEIRRVIAVNWDGKSMPPAVLVVNLWLNLCRKAIGKSKLCWITNMAKLQRWENLLRIGGFNNVFVTADGAF